MYNDYFQNLMGGYNYSPYQNGYNANQSSFQQRQEIVRVNGENGARAFNLAPNSSALLLDENNPIVWVVQADGAGYKTVVPYIISPYQAEPKPDYNSLDQRIRKLEEMVNGKSNTTNAKQSEQSNANAPANQSISAADAGQRSTSNDSRID